MYRLGKRSANADTLSRSPQPDSTTGVAKERDSEPLVGAVKSNTSSAFENSLNYCRLFQRIRRECCHLRKNNRRTLTSVPCTSSWRNGSYQRTLQQRQGLLYRHLCLQCQTKYCTSSIQSQSIIDGSQSRSIYAGTLWTRPIEAEWESTSQDKDCTMPSTVIGSVMVCILHAMKFSHGCPECLIVKGSSRHRPPPLQSIQVSNYTQGPMAETTICKAQWRYKGQFDRRAQQHVYKVGDWVIVKFTQEEQGRMRTGPCRLWRKSCRWLKNVDSIQTFSLLGCNNFIGHCNESTSPLSTSCCI